jgi:hypothetical protein
MQSGVYRKIQGHTGVGLFYQFLLLAREHTTGAEAVVYIPLRVERAWAGTVRPCYMARAAFETKFEYVGEGLPPAESDERCTCGHSRDDHGNDGAGHCGKEPCRRRGGCKQFTAGRP